MSESLVKMWTSLFGMGMMFLSVVFIFLSRYKLKNRIIKFVLALIAYCLLVVSAILLFIVVFSGFIS